MSTGRSDQLLSAIEDEYRTFLDNRGVSPKSADQLCHQLARCGIQDDGRPDLARLRSRALAPKTRRLISSALRSYARFVSKEDPELGASIMSSIDEVKLPAAVRQKIPTALPRPAFDALRSSIDSIDLREPLRAVLGIMACRGIRRGDVLRMKRQEIAEALRTGALNYEAKGGRRLEFGVTKNWRRYLEALDEAFSGTKKQRVHELVAKSEAAAEKAVVRALERAAADCEGELAEHDLVPSDVHCHKLRHTYASMFYEACGRDPARLQAHMGWAAIATAMGYVHVSSRAELDDVAEEMLG